MLSLIGVLAEGAKTINPVVPDDPGEIFWSVITFFSLWIILRYVCLPPLLKGREERTAKAIADAEAASAAETQTEQVRRDYDTTLAEARQQAARIVEEARAASDARRAEAVRQAEAEVASLKQAEIAALDAARTEALAALRTDVRDLAVTAASVVVGSDVDRDASQATIDQYVDQANAKR